jgi:hypothetical protein
MPRAVKPKPQDSVRRGIARTLLSLRLRHAKLFDEIDGLKASLILNAKKAGEGFREVFDKKGIITVAAPKDKEFKGEVPEVDPDAFGALPEAKRQKLIAEGIVKIVPHWSRDFHGRVDVKTFAA